MLVEVDIKSGVTISLLREDKTHITHVPQSPPQTITHVPQPPPPQRDQEAFPSFQQSP